MNFSVYIMDLIELLLRYDVKITRLSKLSSSSLESVLLSILGLSITSGRGGRVLREEKYKLYQGCTGSLHPSLRSGTVKILSVYSENMFLIFTVVEVSL